MWISLRKMNAYKITTYALIILIIYGVQATHSIIVEHFSGNFQTDL